MHKLSSLSIISQIYKWRSYELAHEDEMLAFLSTCMGKRIAKVRLSKCEEQFELPAVTKLIQGKQIDYLEVSVHRLSDIAV